MAQSDFNFTEFLSSAVGGGQGSAFINSNLGNPLAASYGTYCRQYKIQPSGVPNGFGAGQYCVWNGFVNEPAFVGVPNTKALSLRAVVRTQPGIQPDSGIGVGLRARTGGGSGTPYTTGYCLLLGDTVNYGPQANYPVPFNAFPGPYTYGLYLLLRDPAGGYYPGTFPDTLMPGTFTPGVWYPIRMDILPFGNLQDTINVYVGSMDVGGNITWGSPVYTTTVISGQAVFNPASPSLLCGYTALGTSRGFSDTSNPPKAYIDGLDFRIAAV